MLNRKELPDQDSNLDKQNQNLLCYRYTIGQAGVIYRMVAMAGKVHGIVGGEFLQSGRVIRSE